MATCTKYCVSQLQRHSANEASRLAALFVGQMHPAFSLLASCDPGASALEYVTVMVQRSTKGLAR
jgi:hypothetical protein